MQNDANSPFQAPQLATLVERPPEGPNWIHEIKYDGYRMMTIKRDAGLWIKSRNGVDWSERLATLNKELLKLNSSAFVLDGELVVLNKKGQSDFALLKEALSQPSKYAASFRYYVFDLLEFQNKDLRSQPLKKRKEILKKMMNRSKLRSHLFLSESLEESGEKVLASACQRGLEGIVSKNLDAPYIPGRSKNWLKTKCIKRQEFIIGGFSDPEGSRKGFGALLLGYYDDKKKLIYAGRVGTGFNSKTISDLSKRLKKLTSPSCFSEPLPSRESLGSHFVKPVLMAEIKFSEWTPDGRLRHPVFVALREDKDPRSVHRDRPLED